MKTSKILVALMLTILLLPIVPIATAAPPSIPTVKTDQKYYHPGDTLQITGFASKAGQVTLSFLAGGVEVDSDTVMAATDGKYQYEYDIPANPERGIWNVEAKDTTPKTASTTFVVLNVGPDEIGKKLLEIAEGTMVYTEGKLGDEPPRAAQENFDAGKLALEEARSLLHDGKYQASVEATLRAQKHFGNALRILARDNSEEDHDDDGMRLESQIERAQKMLDTLKKIYNNVKDNLSESMSQDIDDELEAAQTDLNTAKSKLDNKLTDAETALGAAKLHIETAKDLLNDYAKEKKRDNIAAFIDRAIERIDKLTKTIDTLRERIGVDKAGELITKLHIIKEKLVSLKADIADGATVEDVNQQMKYIRDLLDSVRDDTIRGALKEMDSMRAWIQIMKDTRGMWMRKGFNTNELDTKIKVGEDHLGWTIGELAAGRKMNGKFSEIVKGFQEMFKHRGG